mgnify:CR=1 FL=1
MIEGALLLFFLAMPDYLKGSVFQNLGQLFQFRAFSAVPVNFTQVPQEELKFLGTGMITAG